MRMALNLAIQVGLNEMKPNTQALAITTGLIFRSPGPIRRYPYPINIAVQPCAALLGFTWCVQPNQPAQGAISAAHCAVLEPMEPESIMSLHIPVRCIWAMCSGIYEPGVLIPDKSA